MLKKSWVSILLFVAAIGVVAYLYVKYRVAPDLAFADLPLQTPEGQTVKISDYKGKVIFLNFWQTWCGPCVGELPSIDHARAQLDSTKFVFITVSDENAQKIGAFRDQHDYHFLSLISGKKFQELGVNTYPTTYIIDTNGEVFLTKIGAAEWDSEEMLQQLKALSK